MGIGRRIRWAERENARLAAEYQRALAVWKQNEKLIEWYHDQAGSARPLGRTEGLKLRRGEQVLWTASDVSMIEVPEATSLFTPVHEVFSPIREAGGYLPLAYAPTSVRDFGFVAVTDSRVLFVGGKSNREWAFAQLDGVAHGAQVPMTLMRVGNRQRLSGLVFPNDRATQFQFYLGLALAEHRHDRAGFVAHLESLLVHHRRRPPLVPAPALPEHAPSGADLLGRLFFGRPGAPTWRKLAPAMVTVVGMLCMCGVLVSSPQSDSAGRQAPAAGPAGLSTSAPAVTQAPSPVQEASPTQAPVIQPPTTKAPPVEAPRTKAAPTKPTTVNLCGAPANPWNYDFCGGSSRVTDPPSEFCLYFECIDNFWNGRGYVIQCNDNMFSKSGGIQGSCSYHQGNRRPLNK